MRLRTVFVPLVLLVLGLGACEPGEDPDADGTAEVDDPEPDDEAPDDEAPDDRITLRLPGGDSGFPSPFGYRRGGGYMKMQLLYETLLWKDGSGELEPWLAESFEESDDGTTYTFDLRDDVQWHDGEPLTAEDVAFTFGYFAEEDISPQVIVQPDDNIEEVVATDELTVEFRLSNPQATFVADQAGAVPIAPEHIWSDVSEPGQVDDLGMLVGTGPYELEEYSPGAGSYLYTAFDDYHLGEPVVERIEYAEVDDELTALRAGEVAVGGGGGLRPDALAPFEDDDAFEVLQAPIGAGTTSLYWNLAAGGALADVDFRRATAMAIDREDFVERLFGGNAVPGNPAWLPPTHPHYADVEQYEYDPDAANELLDEAGYEMGDDGVRIDPQSGEPLSFELLTRSPPPPEADLLVEAFEAVGVELEPASVDTPTFNERVIDEEVELSLIGAGGLNSDPNYLREVYHSQTERTQHAQGYENPELDDLLDEQLVTLDEDRRAELIEEAQHLIAEDLPFLPLFYPDSYTIYDREVFDAWYYTPGGVAVRVPNVQNRHVFVAGQESGLPNDR